MPPKPVVWFPRSTIKRAMTPEVLDKCLSAIGWTPDILARQIGCHVSLVEAWLTGEAEIPLKAGVWIKVLADCHVAANEGKPRSLKGKRFDL